MHEFKGREAYTDRLMQLVNREAYDQALGFFDTNRETFSSGHDFTKIYKILVKIPRAYYKTTRTKLYFALFSFLSGDNFSMKSILIDQIDTSDTPEEFILRHTILAISSNHLPLEERISMSEKALLAIDACKEDHISAYACFVYAQLLTGVKAYSKANHYFDQAYHMFMKGGYAFMGATVFTSWQLSLWTQGNYKQVIRETLEEIKMNSSLHGNGNPYIDLYSIPLGVSYFMLNKVTLACQVLEKALESIVAFELIHMYTFIVYWLLNGHLYQGQVGKAEDLMNWFSDHCKAFEDPVINLLVLSGKIHMAMAKSQAVSDHDVEALELACIMNQKSVPYFVKETLMAYYLLSMAPEGMRFFEENESDLEDLGNPSDQIRMHILYQRFYSQKGVAKKAEAHAHSAMDKIKDYGAIVYLDQVQVAKLELFDLVKDCCQTDRLDLNDLEYKSALSKLNKAYDLTNREVEILFHLARGYSNKELSDQLFISLGTVKWHLNHIYSKLNVKGRFEAIKIAYEYDLVRHK